MKKRYSKPQLILLEHDRAKVEDYQIIMRFADEATPGTAKSIGQALIDQLQAPGKNSIFCQENENMR